MQEFSLHPYEILQSVSRNRYLIKKSIQREVNGRYRGSYLGVFWSFFTPLLMLAVYTFVFSVVFKARWNTGGESKTEFALVLYAGLMMYQLFAECINRSPGLITGNSEYVKRVVFPIEILPINIMGAAIFHTSISVIVWLLAHAILFGPPPLTVLYLPLIILPLIFLTLGLSWFLASLGVYVRDVAQIIGIFTTALLFLSPIFYSASRLPPNYQLILHLNPLTGIIENVRNALLWGNAPHPIGLTLQYLFSIIVCCLGFAWFQKTRKGFADVV